MIKESHSRSVLKAITWRVTATTTTTVVTYFVTGELTIALTVGFFEFIIKIFIYYLHERAWLAVGFGKIKNAKRR